MMEFVFPPNIQAGIASGVYEVVKNQTTGQFIGVARDAVTKQFVGNAVGTVANNVPMIATFAANPVGGAVMVAGKVVSAAQNQAIIGKLSAIQASLGVLQATTAVIGVGVAATAALSAVNVWQTMKLKKEVQQMRLEIRDGFLDLKQALRDQGFEVMQHIDEVAKDIKFEQHRIELAKAYARFIEATKLIKTSLAIEDIDSRKRELSNARQTLGNALAIYNSPDLLSEMNVVGQLRRLECAWTIEQTIALTYHIQGEATATSNCLRELQDKIRRDCLIVIDRCETQDELDFLFPEITCIHDRDLALLELWQNQIDWARSLPPEEQSQLANLNIPKAETTDLPEISKPPELIKYEEIQPKSHPDSLLDQLKLLFDRELRQEYEEYISQKAQEVGYKALVKDNLTKASNLAVANLFWYFYLREETPEETIKTAY